MHFSWNTDIPENIRLRSSLAEKNGDNKEKPKKEAEKKLAEETFEKGTLLDTVNLQIFI